MHANAELIERLYAALEGGDGAAMGACYADGASFTDPVFGTLDAVRVRAMWRMLCGAGSEIRVELSGVRADESTGAARWEATYRFTATGRRVVNRIDAAFKFQGGLIVEQRDSFSLWRWAAMALGPRGRFLGWLPPVRSAIRRSARGRLDAFLEAQGLSS